MYPHDIIPFLFILGILFLVIVAPIWIILHYARSKRAHSILSREDRQGLHILEEKAEDMAERIETLESILDNETPAWRRKGGGNE